MSGRSERGDQPDPAVGDADAGGEHIVRARASSPEVEQLCRPQMDLGHPVPARTTAPSESCEPVG
jgi:hypothetical protein